MKYYSIGALALAMVFSVPAVNAFDHHGDKAQKAMKHAEKGHSKCAKMMKHQEGETAEQKKAVMMKCKDAKKKENRAKEKAH